VTVNLPKGEHHRTEFLDLNPAGKVPVLIDDGKVITESIAIVLYLAEKYPERNLLPKDIAERAQCLRWLMFTTTELEQPLWRMALHSTLYPEPKRSPSEIAVAADDFAAMAQVAERHMSGREFVVGDRVSVADFVLAYTLDWAEEARVLGGFPSLNAYMERMYARPHAPVRIAEALASVKQ
jgi:glutathione S-transferase